jgi:branched-subunit amino acid aminotransferase/4-amino-4-deoxychorismate lyase
MLHCEICGFPASSQHALVASTVNVVPSSPILVILIMEALSSSETSVLTRTTRRNIPEDTILHMLHYSYSRYMLVRTSARTEHVFSYLLFQKSNERATVMLCQAWNVFADSNTWFMVRFPLQASMSMRFFCVRAVLFR